MPESDRHSLGLFRQILRIRLIEEMIAERYAEQLMRCPVHLSIGQESAAVGVCAALEPDDLVFSAHRCHSHYLAKGGDLKAMMAEIHGRATGCCGGRGGSMHLIDDAVRMMMSLPIVGSVVPIAVGAALSAKQAKTGQVAVVFFGDGATEEGAFHEAANFASLHSLPVVFVCENNLYAVYTHLDTRQPDRDMTRFATCHGIVSRRMAADSVEAVYDEVLPLVDHVRSGKGPAFVQLDTYRYREHCGPEFDDHLGYRDEGERATWLDRDPVELARRALGDRGTLTDAMEDGFRKEILAEIDEAFEFALSSPFPDPATSGEHVYA